MADPSSQSPDPNRPDGAERSGADGSEGLPPEASGEARPPEDSPEEHLALKDVKGRAVRATGALMSRQVIVRGINFVGLVILAKILDPATFGLFAVVRFIVMFLQRFSDFGLSATLIRKQDAVTEAELKTVFTIQQTIVAIAFLILWFGTDVIVGFYPELDMSHVWLIRVLAFSLVLASLKTMPTVLIQRALRHDKLAVIDVVEVVAYFVVTVGLAVLGYGIWALIWGTLARGVIGTVWLLVIAWWRPRFGFDRAAAKEVLTFGVPIQMASLAGLANESVVPLVVLAFFGKEAVGFANW
ncbi:MAG: oligosaccharide flippase family protein, partial [Bacteroidota bacterium]